ncbi:MAG: TQO small subunit DoxD [Nitrososphaeria archaeon]
MQSPNVDQAQMALPIMRITLGWLYFSAMLRRVWNVPAKMNPSSPLYVGGKLITFIPHSLFIGGILQYTLLHPTLLFDFLVIWTILEGVFGLFMMLGFMSRLSGLVIALLAWGIGLGAGWIGTTCLDEWQIAAVEGAAALVFAFAGSRWLSIDQLLVKKYPNGLRIGRWDIPLW